MSGGMTVELEKNARRLVEAWLGNYVWFDPYTTTDIEYTGSFMKLQHNS